MAPSKAINGKDLDSHGGIADQYVLFARPATPPSLQGLSAFVVEAGYARVLDQRADRYSATPCHDPYLRQLPYPGRQRCSAIWAMASGNGNAMCSERVARSDLRRAADEAIQRSKERQAFVPIQISNLSSAKIADMAVKVDAMALLIYRLPGR